MTQRVVQATASIMQTPLATSTITSAATGPAIEPSSANVGRAANVSPTAAASQPVTPTAVRGCKSRKPHHDPVGDRSDRRNQGQGQGTGRHIPSIGRPAPRL